MAGDETERRLLENVLDALDDLYDRRDRAEWWTERLLLATSAAFRGTQWERPMAEAATAIELIQRGDGTYDDKNAAALAATGDLRLQVAHALEALPLYCRSSADHAATPETVTDRCCSTRRLPGTPTAVGSDVAVEDVPRLTNSTRQR